jgi:pyruvate,orthophosphate dikinase
MTLSQTTQSQSGTGTQWDKKGLVLKASGKSLKSGSKTGALKSNAKLVYAFGGGKAEGDELNKGLLGGKGANLHGMTKLGLPVPPGFTVTTEVCTFYYQNKQSYPKPLEKQVRDAMARVEKLMGKKFGGTENPLLVSVRSGARASMPGMMDTILNLGLNDRTVEGLAESGGGGEPAERFAWDSYRRFITMYSDVVLDVHSNLFEAAL